MDTGMGTDMSGMTQMGGGTMGGPMKPWLHFTRGDTLYFNGWVPVSKGAVVGACIGLFLLAIVERWVTAICGVMHVYWARKTNQLLAARRSNQGDNPSTDTDHSSLSKDTTEVEVESLHTKRVTTMPSTMAELRRTAPFIPAHDFARGAIHACKAGLGYALMLAVMTFNAGYIIAIILGLGAGEVLFGRFGATAHDH